MVRHARIAILVAWIGFLAAISSGAIAATSVAHATARSPITTCAGQPVSSIDQYCEQVPTAGGPSGTGPTTPELARTLPRAVALKLLGSRRLGRLLTLPSAGLVKRPGLSGQANGGSANSSSIWRLVAAVLAGVAVLLALLAAVARRRRRGRAQPQPA